MHHFLTLCNIDSEIYYSKIEQQSQVNSQRKSGWNLRGFCTSAKPTSLRTETSEGYISSFRKLRFHPENTTINKVLLISRPFRPKVENLKKMEAFKVYFIHNYHHSLSGI